jgi:hypothetical protein
MRNANVTEGGDRMGQSGIVLEHGCDRQRELEPLRDQAQYIRDGRPLMGVSWAC